MTPPLRLLDNETIVVSPSQLEVIRTCPRLWLAKYLYRRTEVVPDAATKGGGAFDQAMNYRYAKCGSSPCTPKVEAEMCAIIDRAYEGVELPLEEFRTPARYKEVVRAYNAHYGAEPFAVLGVQVPFAVLLGEVPVTDKFWFTYAEAQGISLMVLMQRNNWSKLPTHIKVVLRGLLDLFARAADNIVVIDTKTSKSDIGDGYDNSAQIMSYMWAMQELARTNPDSGLPAKVHASLINGVIIRPPYKSASREAKPNDRPRNSFIRTPIEYYSQERLERHRLDTLAWVETALRWVARDHFPQNNRHCNFHMDASFVNYGYYGKSCPYKDACTAPANQYEMILGTDKYMDVKESPMGRVDSVVKEEVEP